MPEDEDDEANNWACLTEADLEADLAECEASVAEGSMGASEGELRQALKRGAVESTSFDADVFFAAPRALQGIAADLQEVLADLDALRFEAASLLASVAHGPLKPATQLARAAGGAAARAAHKEEEVFGVSSALLRPPALELSLPAAATTLAEYQRKLEGLPRVLCIERKTRLCVGEVDKYQDGKDIGRDSLVINGCPISGAQGGYASVVEAITKGLDAAVASTGGAAWPSEASERAAQMVLGVLNRTTSGFAAFEEVLRMFDCMDVVIISPDSAAARPLEAAVLCGCALGRAHTRYAVRRADAAGDPLAVVDAEFTFRVPTTLLGRLAKQPPSGQAWPMEEITAAILLRWS